MRGSPRILVIGSPALGGAVSQALPRCRTTAAPSLLSGLWTIGHEEFEGVVVTLAGGRTALRALPSLRQVAPRARIIVACEPRGEPLAREALQAGADDYVLEPVVADELVAALALEYRSTAPAVPAESLPSIQEITALSDVLRSMGAGLQPTLERLAIFLRQVFQAQGVTVQVGEAAASAGAPGPPVLQEPLRRKDDTVGSISLGPRERTSYLASDAARLADYARLIETIITQIGEQARWQELAWRDDLSGLYNRRYFEMTLDNLISQAAMRRLQVTVVLFDIDDFKSYNDEYGHETGDALIREVAVLLRRCSRENDVVARYGGDEFGVILWDAEQPRVPGSQHPTDPMALAERFGAVTRQHSFQCLGPGAPGPVTISGGLACFPWDGKTRAEILRAADAALLAAKRSGKNHIRLADQAGTMQA